MEKYPAKECMRRCPATTYRCFDYTYPSEKLPLARYTCSCQQVPTSPIPSQTSKHIQNQSTLHVKYPSPKRYFPAWCRGGRHHAYDNSAQPAVSTRLQRLLPLHWILLNHFSRGELLPDPAPCRVRLSRIAVFGLWMLRLGGLCLGGRGLWALRIQLLSGCLGAIASARILNCWNPSRVSLSTWWHKGPCIVGRVPGRPYHSFPHQLLL